jgi:hypothetical protein
MVSISNSSNTEEIAPSSIVLPSIPFASQSTTAPTGLVGISGATIVFFNGTAWKYIAGS